MRVKNRSGQILQERESVRLVNLKPTIFWHLSCPSFQQQPDPPASRLDEFNGTGVSHVPSAVPVNLYDLIPYLEETHIEEEVDFCQPLFNHSKFTFCTQPQSPAGQAAGEQAPLSAPQQKLLRVRRGLPKVHMHLYLLS